MNFKALIAAGALLASQSFAIVGLGFHYAPSFGNKLDGMNERANVITGVDIQHEGFDGLMQGFGFKLWVDILPIIDVEATFNIQFGSYDASLYVGDENAPIEIPLEIELGGTPFGKANPKFVAMNGDLSITYPITTLPIIRPYIGGGVTYYLNSFVLNKEFTGAIINQQIYDQLNEVAAAYAEAVLEQDPARQQELQQVANSKAKEMGENVKQNVQDKAADEGLKTSIGGHALVGLRAKLPIIPVAAYGNFKYYFGGKFHEEFEPGRMAVEVGIGLAL